MSLPINYTTVQVHGTYVDGSGAPAVGTVVFVPSVSTLTDATGAALVMSRPVVAVLANGSFTVTLMATDDPDVSPVGWTYTVTEAFGGGAGRTYSISVPLASAGAGIDLSTAAPVTASNGSGQVYLDTSVFALKDSQAVSSLANERVLRDDYRRVYGDIGLAGKAAIALRFDHHLNQFSTTVLPLLQARGFPFGLALYSDMLTTETDSNTIAWSDVVGWLASGGEVWSHGKSHQNATAQADIIAEIVTSKATLEASMPTVKIKGWMQPGVANPAYNDFDTTSQSSANTYAGQLLRQTFALVECDMGSYLRQLPSGFAFGAEHVTMEGQTLAAMQAQVDAAIAYGAGIEYMLHSNFLGQGGYLSVADYTAFLDYLVTKRDAGLLEILTPAGMYAAHPGLSSRIDLINNGDFVGLTPAAPGRWANLSSPWTVLVDPITGYNYASSAGGTVITQSVWAQEWYRGETFQIEFQARRTDGATSTTPRIILQDAGDVTRLNSTITFPAPATGTGWTTYRRPFTFRNDLTNLTVAFGRNGGGSIDIANCHVYKI